MYWSIVSGRAKFDALGRVHEQYYPTFEWRQDVRKATGLGSFNRAFDSSAPATVTDYDALDRPVLRTLPDLTQTQFAYDLAPDPGGVLRLQTTVTDANGNRKETYRDLRNSQPLDSSQ